MQPFHFGAAHLLTLANCLSKHKIRNTENNNKHRDNWIQLATGLVCVCGGGREGGGQVIRHDTSENIGVDEDVVY